MFCSNKSSSFLILAAVCLLYCILGVRGCVSNPGPPKPKYVGCYKDNKGNRDLPQHVSGTGDMTVDHCDKRCRGIGSKYFGVQSGVECWCGDNYGKFGQAEESSCDHHCVGNTGEVCGGVAMNSVYEIVY